MAILKTWAPGSNNKLLFRKDSKKYHFFSHTSVSNFHFFVDIGLPVIGHNMHALSKILSGPSINSPEYHKNKI